MVTIKGLKKHISIFIVNELLSGVKPYCWEIKRRLLNFAGMEIGKGTKIVGPINVYGKLIIGENSWVGMGFTVHGNGEVVIGNNCDIGPEVTFLTGSHEIGNPERRAGKGLEFKLKVEDGSWVGAKSTLVGNIEIKSGCVIGACALVNKSYQSNVMVAGVPAKIIKKLN